MIPQNLLENDELNFIISVYGQKIEEVLRTKNIGIGFFPYSEVYSDSYKTVESKLNYGDFNITFFSDTEQRETNESKQIVSDFGICTLTEENKVYEFIKIVTPFTRPKVFDFIIAKKNEYSEIIKILSRKRNLKDFTYNNFPIIGLDFTEIQKDTIDFLLNEDFRKYCVSKHIKLKRGIILESAPGMGKTLTVQWLKNKALENKIEFYSFKNADDFIKNQDDYYDKEKKIFVFEDFDAFLKDRTETNNSPNEILGMILNTLEGVNEIDNVVSVFTTNQMKIFDSAFVRPGRIDKVYTYKPPTEKVCYDFLEAYISEEKDFHQLIVNSIYGKTITVSFALLKGICDDINIFKFSGDKLTEEKIKNIINNKVYSSNKKEEIKNVNSFIL